jgi:hypothetical protein
MGRFVSLRTRLILLVLLAVMPTLGLMFYTAYEDRQRETSDIQAHTLQLARIISVEEEQLILATRQLLITLAELPQMQGSDPTVCSTFLADLLQDYQSYTNIGVIKPDGEVFCSALRLDRPINLADRAYFQRALQTHDFAIGDYEVGRII